MSLRDESAKWSMAVRQVTEGLQTQVDKALSDDAGRGFPAPTGDTLDGILVAGQEAKAKLTEANGKIYEEGRQTIFQVREFDLKVLVRLAKLALEAYREKIFNALALEQAQAQATSERQRADVDRLNAETEFRQVAVIKARAEVEQSIITYRRQLVAAERATLGAEELLIQAQLETAEKKLEIITSIYQVLAAEELVLAAERRRADSLEKVLEAQEALAAIKKEMVPFYQDKAAARLALAEAVTREIPVKEDLERLGYDRIALKTAEEEAEHAIREAQENYEMAQQARIRADEATQLARTQARRLLQEYANEVRDRILSKRAEFEEDKIRFRLESDLALKAARSGADVAYLEDERSNVTKELGNLLQNMTQQAMDQAETIRDSADQVLLSSTISQTTYKKILKG